MSILRNYLHIQENEEQEKTSPTMPLLYLTLLRKWPRERLWARSSSRLQDRAAICPSKLIIYGGQARRTKRKKDYS